MDFWALLTIVVLTIFIMSCCGYCCSSKQRGTVLSTPVVVTSTTHTAPGSYPVTQMPPPNAYQQQPMYPPYPTATSGPNQMPMPMPMPSAQPPMPGMQPYPPAVPAANYNPPSYEAAVAGVGVAQQNTYEKQAPYNPNYNAY
ncbi:protein shisa-5 isoform X8 [Bactrocera dorsalis]|uniref:Protein shisa-5 isoform X8 n=1 Tax=Bactrocera dorsalis TaxID=27457 RepID=A0ABM3JJY5_BACDO|nr:protein shisa-5 isoform X8 [Bactrocera dorsalis]XP_049309533.1 protein shisa-5 isoform X8 [Bactrocera dorsalis]XP_049309534.1 protein shisa-5 isoform X8 [Bactrocera dorsalis]